MLKMLKQILSLYCNCLGKQFGLNLISKQLSLYSHVFPLIFLLYLSVVRALFLLFKYMLFVPDIRRCPVSNLKRWKTTETNFPQTETETKS